MCAATVSAHASCMLGKVILLALSGISLTCAVYANGHDCLHMDAQVAFNGLPLLVSWSGDRLRADFARVMLVEYFLRGGSQCELATHGKVFCRGSCSRSSLRKTVVHAPLSSCKKLTGSATLKSKCPSRQEAPKYTDPS